MAKFIMREPSDTRSKTEIIKAVEKKQRRSKFLFRGLYILQTILTLVYIWKTL